MNLPLGKHYGNCVTLKSAESHGRLSKSAFLGLPKDEKKIRYERYSLQSVVRSILPKERVSICLRHTVNKGGNVEVLRHTKTNSAFYNGLRICGSIWICPVCASKISERRRVELKQAVNIHTNNNGNMALLTLTFRHSRDDKLKEILNNFLEAIRRFRSGKRYTKIKDQMKILGMIRSFEITYGQNGFHPHVHILIFYENQTSLKKVEKEMFELWLKACKANNLDTIKEYGLTLENGEKSNDYVSKWGIEHEMTKSHSKRGKAGGLTPFDFLRKILDDGEVKYKYLFEEYARAVKGKNQLFWSRGLKDRFLIEEKTDEELSKEKLEEADVLGLLEWEDWRKIRKANKRAEFLNKCETAGFAEAYEYIKNNHLLKL